MNRVKSGLDNSLDILTVVYDRFACRGKVRISADETG